MLWLAGLRVAGLVVGGALVLGLLAPSDPDTAIGGLDPLFLLLLIPLLTGQQLLAAAAKAMGRPVVASLLEYCTITGLSLLAYLVLRGAGSWAGAGATVLQFEVVYLLAAALSVALLIRFGIPGALGKRPLKATAIRQRARRARTFATIELAGYAATWSSLIVMPFLLSAEDVGLFNAALRIAALVSIVAVSIPTVLVPRLAVAHAAGDFALELRLIRTMRMAMLAAAIAFFAGIVLLGDGALRLFGPEFAGAYAPMVVTSAGLCLALALGPAGASLNVMGQEHLTRNVTMIGGALTLVAMVPAIWAFGLLGGAAVTGLSATLRKTALVIYEQRALTARREAR